MILALVGSGEYLPPMEPVDRRLLALVPEPAQVVCLPTAAGSEGTAVTGSWSRRGVAHFTRLGVAVEALPVVDRASANDETLAGRISHANFIYLSGGKPGYLADTLRDSLAWQAILHVIQNGGLLAGCSAGAMVQGEIIFGFPRQASGFGLIPGVQVIPHFDEIPRAMISVARLWVGPAKTVLGIEGNTALVRQPDGSFEVIGSGGVTVWTKEQKTRYLSGPLPEEATAIIRQNGNR
jgi:cyanophycinase